MDDVTRSVRSMYEKYPYPPAATPTLRVGSDARMLLSHGKKARQSGQPIHVLDAGCGRAAGLVGAAMLQRDVQFVGVDVNRVALEEAARTVEARQLTNVRLAAVDLMTLEGLVVPPGGFDVIVSSGVLHHLSDPAAGLARLREVLAPHGMLSIMVYGREGRHALYRTVRAIDLLAPRSLPIEARLEVARELVRTPAADALLGGPWADAPTVTDAELVDRYVHVHETSYDVRSLLALLETGGFRHVRWNEPELWDAAAILPPALAKRAASLDPVDRWSLVEEMTYRPMLDLVACHADNEARAPLTADAIADARLAVSPEVSFSVETRCVRGEVRTEKVVLTRRRDAIRLPVGPLAAAAMILRDQTSSFRGGELVDALVGFGCPRPDAQAAIVELVNAEVLYPPHAADV